MEALVTDTVQWMLSWLVLPSVGLAAVFLISLLAATLLPLGSEPAVLAYVALSPEMLWPAVAVATLGNTLGGVISFLMGAGARTLVRRLRPECVDDASRPRGDRWQGYAERWVQRFGPVILLLSWVPLVGDPICAVAGWLRLPFLPCLAWMALGKFARYAILGGALVQLLPAR